MKTHKWAIRIGVALVAFTAVICLTAPAQATMNEEQAFFVSNTADVVEHQSEVQIKQYIEHEAACYALAKVIDDEYQLKRHIFNLTLFVDEYSYTMIHTIGYTEGYLAAISYVAKVPKLILATERYNTMCLEKS